MQATPAPLLTAEEYLFLPDRGFPTELVRGKVVRLEFGTPRHGFVCSNVSCLLSNFVHGRSLGQVVCNNAGVITKRSPDTVRGPDVSYYSYERLPRGPLPDGYLDVVPELVFEVRSPIERWAQITVKVGEYLGAGVQVVCVLDSQVEALSVYSADELPRVLTADDDLTLPGLFGPDFRVTVRRFFE
jgi:Uma2 family endonuclease